MNTLKIITGILKSKLLGKPFYVHFYVTRQCNLKCRMCNVWKNKDKKNLSLEEIKIAANKIQKLGVSHVVITGGEPLIRKDLPEIISIFSKLNISTRLQTNGLILTEEKLDQLIKAGLDDITISLDTLDDKKQDYICGLKNINVASKSLKMLELIVKKMPKSMIAANIVVSHKNLMELIFLIKFLDSKGIWSTFVPVNLAEEKEDYLFKAKSDEFKFNKEDKQNSKKIYNQILKLKKQGYKILVSSKFLKQSPKYINDNNKKWKCDAGELYFSIFPDGSFSPCDEIPTEMNILDKDFLQKYKSKEFKNFLKNVQNTCEGCFYGCWKETSNLINDSSVIWDRFLTILKVKKKELFQSHKSLNKQNFL